MRSLQPIQSGQNDRKRNGLVHQTFSMKQLHRGLISCMICALLPVSYADTFYIAGGEAAGAISEGFRVDIDTGDAGLSKGDLVTWRPRLQSLTV